MRRSPRVPKPLPSSQDTLMPPPAASVTPTEVRPGKRGRKPKNWVPPGKESPIEPAKATVIAITPKMMSSPAIVTTHNIFSISPSKPDPRMTLTRMNGTGQLPYASPYAPSLPCAHGQPFQRGSPSSAHIRDQGGDSPSIKGATRARLVTSFPCSSPSCRPFLSTWRVPALHCRSKTSKSLPKLKVCGVVASLCISRYLPLSQHAQSAKSARRNRMRRYFQVRTPPPLRPRGIRLALESQRVRRPLSLLF